MSRLLPLRREDLPDFEPLFAMVEQTMGYVPNSMLNMARWPELLQAFGGLLATTFMGGKIDPELRTLVSLVTSRAAGCMYCQAHSSHGANRVGVSDEKLNAAFEFATSPIFSDRERAALRYANDAALVPNAVTEAHFTELRRSFDEREIIELTAIISLFGFLNRWNDTLGTPLEAIPLAFAEQHLRTHGWDVGKHAS